MNALFKSLLIAMMGCSIAQVCAMKPALQPIEEGEDVIYEIFLSDGKTLLDEKRFRQVLEVIKPSLSKGLGKESRIDLKEISKLGFGEIISNIDAIVKKDQQALGEIWLHYMATMNHEAFCDFVLASHVLGIEGVVASAQEFFAKEYKQLIDQEDSTFFVKLLTFLKNRFSRLGTLGRMENGATCIGYAASQGKGAVISALLACGVSADLADGNGVTPLIEASKNGHTDVVVLLRKAKANINGTDSEGKSALIEACINGHSAVVKELLVAKASVALTDGEHMTALHHAVMHGHDDCIMLLGGNEAQANLNAYKRKIRSDVMMFKRNPALMPARAPIQLVQPEIPQALDEDDREEEVVSKEKVELPRVEEDEEESFKDLHEFDEQEMQRAVLEIDAAIAARIQQDWENELQSEALAQRLCEQDQENETVRQRQLKNDAEFAQRLQEEPSYRNPVVDDSQDIELALRLHEEELRKQHNGPVDNDEEFAVRLQAKLLNNPEFQEFPHDNVGIDFDSEDEL